MRPNVMGYSRRMRLPSTTPQPAALRAGSTCSALVSASFMVYACERQSGDWRSRGRQSLLGFDGGKFVIAVDEHVISRQRYSTPLMSLDGAELDGTRSGCGCLRPHQPAALRPGPTCSALVSASFMVCASERQSGDWRSRGG